MAKLGSGIEAQSAMNECPIEVFLENIKWQLGVWNKEKWMNDFHDLSDFIILSVWFTIKWQVWNDAIQKYTSTYFSNENRSFNETFYAIEMKFNPTTKTLVAKGNWKEDVKPVLPAWIWIKTGITILDLKDGKVKEFFLSVSEYIGNLQQVINTNSPDTIYWYTVETKFSNWKKNDKWEETFISEKELDELKWREASAYKPRYISSLLIKWIAEKEDVQLAEEKLDLLNEYMKWKKEYYKKTYWEGSVQEPKQYAQINDIDKQEAEINAEIEARKAVQSAPNNTVKNVWATWYTQNNNLRNVQEEISIEDIPF